jgi:hypothetical protein
MDRAYHWQRDALTGSVYDPRAISVLNKRADVVTVKPLSAP